MSEWMQKAQATNYLSIPKTNNEIPSLPLLPFLSRCKGEFRNTSANTRYTTCISFCSTLNHNSIYVHAVQLQVKWGIKSLYSYFSRPDFAKSKRETVEWFSHTFTSWRRRFKKKDYPVQIFCYGITLQTTPFWLIFIYFFLKVTSQ